MTPARSAEQDQFAAALHDLLSRPAPAAPPGADGEPGADVTRHAARRWAAGDRAAGLALWRDLARLGVTALAVPESGGGLGATPLDLVVAGEALGCHAMPGPVAESLAAVPRLLTALPEAEAGRWLRGLAAGDLVATLALPPRLPYAVDADAAGLVLLAEAGTLWLAAPGVAHRSIDPARWLFEVRGQQVLASGPAVARAIGDALRLGTLVSAAQLLGAGQALLDASVRHARVRVQFGQPIGAFQAVQHRLADIAIGLEFARPLLDAAAVALGGGTATAARDVSAARVACADAAHRAARAALQVHGAIGYTREHDLGLYLTKVRALIPAWGTQAQHRAEVIAALTGACSAGGRMELTDDQRALRDAVRGLLTRHSGDDRAAWPRLCREIGVAGLAIPERYGGAGAGPVETHIVLEELGRRLTPSPMLGSAVLAARAILAAGDDTACQRLLPGLAAGTTTAALAWTGPAGRWNPAEVACRASAEASLTSPAGVAHRASAEASLAGEACYVLDGAEADVLLVAAENRDGIALFEVDPGQPGVVRTPVTTMDQTRRLATVALAAASGRRLGSRLDLARVRDLACIALSAEQAGAARQALEETVAYTKVREQFGRVIGSFQGLQHRLADLHVLVESARSLSYAAAEAAADDAPDLDLRAAAARASCSEALTRTAAEMIQMHGAIGITWEHDAHRYFKRAHGDAQLLGPPADHRARIAATLLDREKSAGS